MVINNKIYPELEEIKHEIQSLKILIIRTQQTPARITPIRGMLKGIDVKEEDIKEAKKSLFKFGA